MIPSLHHAAPMRSLPSILEKARSAARDKQLEPLEPVSLERLRRSLADVYDDQQPLIAKILADGGADANETRLLEEALARVARYYEVAHGFDVQRALEEPHGFLVRSIELQSLALMAAIDGDRDEAFSTADAARKRLDNAAEPGAETLVDEGAAPPEKVYDRTTGRSKYDAREEAYLTYRLRCPRESCAHSDDYRLPPRQSAHRLNCASCRTQFNVYVAVVISASVRPGVGAVSHEVVTRDHDGTRRQLRFDEVTDPPGLTIRERDLVVAIYDDNRRLCIVRNYTRGGDVWVAPQSRCFVVTAAHGEGSWELEVLRRYRDERLRRHRAGRSAIAAYERVGPSAARWIRGSTRRRAWARRLTRAAARWASQSED